MAVFDQFVNMRKDDGLAVCELLFVVFILGSDRLKLDFFLFLNLLVIVVRVDVFVPYAFAWALVTVAISIHRPAIHFTSIVTVSTSIVAYTLFRWANCALSHIPIA